MNNPERGSSRSTQRQRQQQHRRPIITNPYLKKASTSRSTQRQQQRRPTITNPYLKKASTNNTSSLQQTAVLRYDGSSSLSFARCNEKEHHSNVVQECQSIIDHNTRHNQPRDRKMIDFSETCIAVYDLETNNFYPKSARIIQAAYLIPHSCADPGSAHSRSLQTNIFPGYNVAINEGAYKAHGISLEDLEGCPETKESTLRLLAKLKKMKGTREKLALVGHNVAAFDIIVTVEEMIRNDISLDQLTNVVTHYIDTYELVKKYVWDESEYEKPKSLKLGVIYEHLFSTKLLNAHSALGDAKGNLAVLLKLDPTLKFAAACMKPLDALLRKKGYLR